MNKKIDLSEWYTAVEAQEKLSENAGREININYPRTLARYGKVESIRVGARGKLYRKKDVDVYVVTKQQRQRPKQQGEETGMVT